jgi:hypothetical protein
MCVVDIVRSPDRVRKAPRGFSFLLLEKEYKNPWILALASLAQG